MGALFTISEKNKVETTEENYNILYEISVYRTISYSAIV